MASTDLEMLKQTEREGEGESLGIKMFSIKNTLIADQKLKLEGSGIRSGGVQSFISLQLH